MKKVFVAICVALLFMGCAGMESNSELTEFTIESTAMVIGYELQGDFEWTSSVQAYYDAIMADNITIAGAQAAEAYLGSVIHPMIANRLVRLAGMVGFDLNDAGSIIGVGNVDKTYLKAAARGFKMGLELVEE